MHIDELTEAAADLAATAAFLEMAEELGISALLERGTPFTLGEAVRAAQTVPNEGMATFLAALASSGIVHRGTDGQSFAVRADFGEHCYQAGYVAWALNANRPYLENAGEFLRDYDGALRKYSRDGRRVAVSSRWVGTRGFYPQAFAEITAARPRHVVDLGAGAGGLLVNVLRELGESTGVALDLSTAACAEAVSAAARAGLGDRLKVVNRSIQSLVEDPSPLVGADVVHGGFVMHDIAGDEDTFDAVLRTCRASLASAGKMVILDAVPYAASERERAFSALFSYLHAQSMGVKLPSEDWWQAAFRRAGFTNVSCTPLRMPTGRMFVMSG